MTSTETQLLLSIVTVAGAGVSVYVGVRVALAEVKRDIANLNKDCEESTQRIVRLENIYFHRGSTRRGGGD
ncbi:MAG: hypothetical protein M3416_01440 [Acidobacteriota bacterium]|nr:hypothetical protein [Acidobacteriota bacterium]